MFVHCVTKETRDKGKSEHLYSALHGIQTAQAWITQLLTCKEHHAILYLVSVHQMVPPLNVVAVI